MTWLLGLIIFIDDYANTLLLGHTMRPLADRLRISREKLAYLVDSTAAPVSGLALISTWVAGEIGYIEAGFESLKLPGEPVDGFAVFVATIPYRFYVLWALLMVPLIALLGRDFGPMLAAERRTLRGSGTRRPGEHDQKDVDGGKPRWFNAVIPVVVTIAVTVWLLIVTGSRETGTPLADALAGQSLVEVFGNGNSYLALVYGSLAGLFAAAILSRVQGILSASEIRSAAFDGARLVIPALTILWLAWALSDITSSDHLGTGEYLGSLLEQAVDVRLMPTMVFILSSLVAFSTGTSWGTMGILMPIVVGATFQMLVTQTSSDNPQQTLMIASIASVLAGAIFGDHCSPISDTTVLSSQASGCDHVSHVWTQFPYAMTVAIIAVVLGTLPVGFGIPVWPLLGVGSVALVTVLLTIGRRVEPA